MIDLYSAKWIDAGHYELRADARRFENWESNYAAKLGFGCAIDYALAIGLGDIEIEVSRLADSLRAKLAGVSVHDIGKRKCGIVTFSVAGVDSSEVESRLRALGINVSMTTPSSTLIDATRRELPDMVRSSVHYYNEDSELEALVNAVTEIARHAPD